MSDKKLLLRIRYPDDPDREWITLEREKPRRERTQLSGEQRLYMTAIKAGALVTIVLFLCVLKSCGYSLW